MTHFDPGGRFTATGAPLSALMQEAYGIKGFQISGGPSWVNSERYDVVAKPNAGANLSQERLKPMIQALLAERFQLKIHRETKDLTIYSLMAGKDGPKLHASTGASGPGLSMGRGQLSGHKVSMTMLASILELQLDRNVRDNTGIQGDFDIKLEWSPDETADRAGPSIFTALQEQLGLKLGSQKGPVEVLVIDSAEKASAN
jgi:uncharacterized protein (TIGR03435 family)